MLYYTQTDFKAKKVCPIYDNMSTTKLVR